MDGGYSSEKLYAHRCRACGHVWDLRHIFDGGPSNSYMPIAADCPECGYNTWTPVRELIGPPEPLTHWWGRKQDESLLKQLGMF